MEIFVQSPAYDDIEVGGCVYEVREKYLFKVEAVDDEKATLRAIGPSERIIRFLKRVDFEGARYDVFRRDQLPESFQR